MDRQCDSACGNGLDKRLVRRGFDKAAAAYERSAVIDQEIGQRLLDHLVPIRVAPLRVLDLGAGTGLGTRELAKRYPKAEVVALDFALAMLRRARRAAPRFLSRQRFVAGDAERLPFARQCFDLVHSNLLLHWCDDPPLALGEVARVTKPGGLLVLSTLGPDTLQELKESWLAIDTDAHVHDFPDMHDVGDALVRAGFADVVVDSETLTVHYRSVDDLLRDLRSTGNVNRSARRRHTLTGGTRFAAMREAYLRVAHDGVVPATMELIFAHAWATQRTSVEVPLAALRRR